MNFSSIIAKLEAFAVDALATAKNEGIDLAGKVVVDVENAFEDLVNKLGPKATQLVTDLFADDTLSGLEKNNLAATQLAEHAAQNGIVVASHDITALIKNAFLVVQEQIAKL